MVATGAGWMHGIVKAVPSGDSVLIMGNTGQVRARARGDRRVDLGVSVERCVRSDRRPSDLSARDGSRACRLSSTDPDRVPRSPLAGWPAAGEDHHARLAHRPEDGASRVASEGAIRLPNQSASRPRLPDFLFPFSVSAFLKCRETQRRETKQNVHRSRLTRKQKQIFQTSPGSPRRLD
jgi:hypothetical protein